MKAICLGLIVGGFCIGSQALADGSYVRITELHQFSQPYNAGHINPWDGAEGGHPVASLYEGTDAKLYGITPVGGPNQIGCTDGSGVTHSCSSSICNPDHDHQDDIHKYCPGTIYRLSKTGTGFSVLHAFTALDSDFRNSDGYKSYSTLVPGPSGYLYGMATLGGSGFGAGHPGCGVAFKFLPSNPSGTYSVIHNFCSCTASSDGANPYGTLVPDGNGDFYGATKGGTSNGNGSIFKLSESNPTTCTGGGGSISSDIYTLRSFGGSLDGSVYASPRKTNVDGASPFGSPILDGTKLFGVTNFGGSSSNFDSVACNDSPTPPLLPTGGGFGTVFSYNTSTSTFSKIQDQKCFSYADRNPDEQSSQSMIIGTDANYYGTVQMGGDHNSGYVFKLTPSTGTVSKLHSFADISVASTPHYSNGDGAQPMSTLVEGHDGFLYGTTFYGGSNGTGVIFQMKKTGSDYLVLYEFPAAGTTSTLSGCFPHSGLIQGTDGVFYGTTTLGGTDGSSTLLNFGTVFKMDPPLSFESLFNEELSTVYESPPILVTNLVTSAISIAGGEYKIGSGSWTSTPGTVAMGNTLRVRTTSSASYNTRVLATVLFGSLVNSSFGVTTKAGP